jgi:hypothetical protein
MMIKLSKFFYLKFKIYRAYKHKAPFIGFFQSFRPYILAMDPAMIKKMFITDFKNFRNNDFWVSDKTKFCKKVQN